MNTLPTTWAEVAKQKGLAEVLPFDLSMLDEVTQSYLSSCYRLPIIIETLNGGWIPDYTNRSQPKFEIFFEIIADKERPSGFGLAYHACDWWTTLSFVGVRLCFKDRPTAEHAITYFMPELERFILKIA